MTENLCFKDIIKYKDMVFLKGKTTFISGESGTGKSTLLKLLTGILSPSKGRVLYNGKDITESDTLQLRKEVSLISQDVFLFDCSIKDNFLKFYEYRDQVPPTDEEIIALLKLFCITFPLDKDCTTMSGGERQRVYIAIFLSFMPKVILLDEPTSALDNKTGLQVMENVIMFCKDKNIDVIVVSHDKTLADNFTECSIIIERSRD
jgi:putative ABC transport system ATP-binding protein